MGILNFISKYLFILLFVLPVWTILGVYATPSLLVVIPLSMLFLYYRGMQDHLIILFLIALILGDSRFPVFDAFENARVVMVVTFIFLIAMDMIYGKYGLNGNILWLIPFILSALISLSESPVGILGVTKTISFFLIYLIGLNFFNYYIRIFGKPLVFEILQFFHLILGIGLLFVVISPDIAFYENTGRFRGVFGNPNGIGSFSAFVFMYASIALPYLENQTSKRFERWTWAMVFLSVILSSSRNSIGMIVLFFVVRDSFRGNTMRRLLILGGVLPLILALSQIITFFDIVHVLGLEDFFRVVTITDASGRTFAWAWAWTEIVKNPMMGMGFTYEDYIFYNFLPIEVILAGHQGGVHNSYLVFLLNTGFVGLVLFFVFYFRTLLSIQNVKNAFPYLIATLFSATFESWLAASLNFMNTIFILVIVLMKFAEDEWDRKTAIKEPYQMKIHVRSFRPSK